MPLARQGDGTVNITLHERPVLHYAYDPMCSWCWAYRPTWLKLQEKLLGHVEICYRVGGLAPDSDQAMPLQMQSFLQGTWRKISSQLGTAFNFDFWTDCDPRRSTYPACRAVMIARAQGLEQAMLYAIQEAYYLQAKNPSDHGTLIVLAESLGMDGAQFEVQLKSESLNEAFMAEIAETRALPIQGFPSLVLIKEGVAIEIPTDYTSWEKSYRAVERALR